MSVNCTATCDWSPRNAWLIEMDCVSTVEHGQRALHYCFVHSMSQVAIMYCKVSRTVTMPAVARCTSIESHSELTDTDAHTDAVRVRQVCTSGIALAERAGVPTLPCVRLMH
eukprot:9834-Heterococcus_DN1.PRE.5